MQCTVVVCFNLFHASVQCVCFLCFVRWQKPNALIFRKINHFASASNRIKFEQTMEWNSHTSMKIYELRHIDWYFGFHIDCKTINTQNDIDKLNVKMANHKINSHLSMRSVWINLIIEHLCIPIYGYTNITMRRRPI